MASPGNKGGSSKRAQQDGQILKELVRTLRSDLNMLSNEAKKKYPAVKEAAERGAMRLKTMSESKGFSINVLAESDDVIHPLLFACETKNLVIVKLALSSLQRLIQNKAIPQKSVQSIVATLRVLMVASVEELKILQTVLLLVSVTEVVQGKDLTKVLELCFQLYGSKESSVHNTAGVAIRQIVSSLYDRVDCLVEEEGVSGGTDFTETQLPTQASDAYLLFQDICFLTNGDPPAWLPGTVDLELTLGLELLEGLLSGHTKVFVKEKLFNQLLTERVCPLIIKLFSPSSKYRHSNPSPVTAALLAADKPTFALSVRLLRILSVLIREFYSCLVTQCEIFLSMLVRFLDTDKPQWQRTLALEILFSFCNDPYLLKSFCECYDMQEHSSRIFGDIIDALGNCIQHSFTSQPPPVQLPFGITSSSSSTNVTNNSNNALPAAGGVASSSGRQLHLFNVRGNNIQVEVLPKSAHTKPIYLEMLDKMDVPLIVEGYPLVVAMNALLYAIKSVSLVVYDKITSRATTPPPTSPASDSVKHTMLKSSWSGVLAALALLLDACVDEQTTKKVLSAHTTYINLCGRLRMTSPRDAFLTSLCKASLPPKYLMSLITQRSKHSETGKTGSTPAQTSSETGQTSSPPNRAPPSHITSSTVGGQRSTTEDPPKGGEFGARRKLKLSEGSGGGRVSGEGVGSVGSEGVTGGGGGGTPTMPTKSLPGGVVSIPIKEQSGLITVKNLQCIGTLLEIVDHYGNILDTAWPLLLNALQHIFEIFGLRPLATGGFKQSGIADNSSLALVSVEKKSDISSLTDRLNALFKSSLKLRDPTVTCMIDSLCQLSDSAMVQPNAREIGLFPIAALLEVGSANTSRLNLVWSPITSHITKVCSHGDSTLRVFAAESLTSLIKAALDTTTEQETKQMMLTPLESLTGVPFADVKHKQLECVAHVLQSTHQSLQSSWSIILDVIKSATDLQSEGLVRTGFQSLQLVMADFLPALPPSCVPVCVEVGGRYGLQKQDINISLTSIGLLWNMADYLFQNKSSLQTSLEVIRFQEDRPKPTSLASREPLSPVSRFNKTLFNPSVPVFDSVWLLLFKYLSELCVDERGAVRKSACQTLFSTISAHGSLLQSTTWSDVLWQVLFPLLDGVTQATWSASTSSFQTAIMIHHSRDTAQKQWAETQVLVLTGAARMFQTWWPVLVELSGFEKAWITFLLSLKTCACNTSSEVSIAAIKSFHIVVDPQSTGPSQSPRNSADLTAAMPTSEGSPVHRPSSTRTQTSEQHNEVWVRAWQAWESIGKQMVVDALPGMENLRSLVLPQNSQTDDSKAILDSLPTQPFLTHFLEVFPHVFSQLKPQFSEVNFDLLCQILSASLQMPVNKDVSPFLVPSGNENLMTALHKLVLCSLGVIFTGEDIFDLPKAPVEGSLLTKRKSDHIDISRSVKLNTDKELTALYPRILSQLLDYFSYATRPPDRIAVTSGIAPSKLPVMVINVVPFGVGGLCLAVRLFRACVAEGVPLPDNMAEEFLKSLHQPLKLKHRCSSQVIWVQSLNALLLVLETVLPSMLSGSKMEAISSFWLQLATVLEDFLFNDSAEGLNLSPDKARECEALDIKVIELVKRDILATPTNAPREFLDHLTSILNRGSIHSATDQLDGEGPESDVPFRENFARVCFEALLQFSFVNTGDSPMSPDSTNQVALKALLSRSEEVLKRFVNDERLSGSCPLPRTRMSEVALVLKSVTILISALKDARKTTAKIDRSVWNQVASLYPALVQCVTCQSQEVRLALREALHQFTDLLQEQS